MRSISKRWVEKSMRLSVLGCACERRDMRGRRESSCSSCLSCFLPLARAPPTRTSFYSSACYAGWGTLLSQCLSPPRSINGYLRTVKGDLIKCGRGWVEDLHNVKFCDMLLIETGISCSSCGPVGLSADFSLGLLESRRRQISWILFFT